MGKKLSELNQQNSATQEEYLLIDKDNAQESHKIKLKDIDVVNFLNGELVNEVKYAMEELGGASLYDGIQKLFKNIPHTHFTNRITSDNTTQAPTVKAVYDYILENGGGGGGGTGTGGSGIKEKVDNPKLWELTSGMYEVTSGFYYTVDNYQSLENTSAILFIGDDSPEQDINYFMIAGRVKYYGVMKIDGSDGTIVTEDFSNEEISESSTNKDIPSSKAVYDFVTSEVEIKASTEPKIWELDKGWHYINQGFYLNESDYFDIAGSILIYKTYPANASCNYYGLGKVYSNQINLIYGDILNVNGWKCTCNVERFTEEINAESPLNHNYPSEKAVVDFVTSEVEIKASTEPKIWELKKGLHYIIKGLYVNEDKYVTIPNGALIFKSGRENTSCNYFGLGIGIIGNNSINTIYGDCMLVGGVWSGDINVNDFVDEINSDYPYNYNFPSEKAIVEFVQGQLNSLIDTAPDKLNTLNELANALNNDENFASTVMGEIGKKIDKEAITTEVSGNSTDDEIASAKAVYDFVVNNKEIEVVTNPKIWELESGLYRVQGGFYHSNEKEVNDLINGETSTITPNQSTVDYEAIDHEMFLIVYKQTTDDPNTICRFVVFGDDTDSYSGIITMSLSSFEDNMYAVYSGNLVSITKTDEINENSTNEQYPSAKAVFDFINNNASKSQILSEDTNITDLETGSYISQQEKSIRLYLTPNKFVFLDGCNIINQKGERLFGETSLGEISKGLIIGTILELDENDESTTYNGIIYYQISKNNNNDIILTEFVKIGNSDTEDVYKKEQISGEISLLDLDTGIYYADASVAPTIVNITSDRQMTLGFGKIINYNLSTQAGETSIRMCNGLIFGVYTSENDDDRQSIIYYSIMEQNGEVNVVQFTDLIEDFLTKEDFQNKLQTTISSSSTDNEIPTAKAVFDYFSTNAHKRQYINSSTYLYELDTGIYEVSATEVLNRDYSNNPVSTTFKPIDIHITDYKIVEMVSGMVLHHRGKVESGVNYDDVYSGLIIGKFGNTIGDTDKEINKVYYYSGCRQLGTSYLLSFIDLTGDSLINEDQITQIINSDSTHSQIPTAKAVYENLEQKSQVQIITWEEND